MKLELRGELHGWQNFEATDFFGLVNIDGTILCHTNISKVTVKEKWIGFFLWSWWLGQGISNAAKEFR